MFSPLLGWTLLAGCRSAPPPTPPASPTAPAARRPRARRASLLPPDRVVDCNGGGDDTTISAAIAAAPDGGRIEVRPCTYHERIDFRGKSLHIASTDGAAATTIDADHDGPVVTASRGEGDRTALVGFTLEDGTTSAVDVRLSALRLQDVVITQTDGAYAIYALSPDLELRDVTIDGSNQSWSQAVFADKGAVSIRGLTLACGNGDGMFLGHGGFLIEGSDLSCPGANDDAIEIEHSVGRIRRSVITGGLSVLTEEDHLDDRILIDNSVIRGDIGIEFGTFALVNSVLDGRLTLTDTADTVRVENSVFLDAGCAITNNVALGPVRHNDFAGGPARCDNVAVVGLDGNIAADPMFVDLAGGDLNPAAGSPLVDAGVPEPAYQDLDGTRNDIGVHGGRFDIDGGF